MIMIVETGLKLIEARNFCDLIQFCFLFYGVIFEGRDEGGGGLKPPQPLPFTRVPFVEVYIAHTSFKSEMIFIKNHNFYGTIQLIVCTCRENLVNFTEVGSKI